MHHLSVDPEGHLHELNIFLHMSPGEKRKKKKAIFSKLPEKKISPIFQKVSFNQTCKYLKKKHAKKHTCY